MLLLPLLLATLPIVEPAEPRAQSPEAEAPVETGALDPALVGHYYLSGVMETGSELLLRADGTYEWYISYGAVDLFSDGTWGRSGDAVVLLAKKRVAGSPLFQAVEQLSWTSDVEERLLQRQADRRNADIARLCPWDVATTSAPSIRIDDPAPTDEDRARAAASLADAERVLEQANRLILASVQEPANDAARSAASEAVDRWYEAVYQAERAYEDASLPLPEFGKPVRPPQCTPERAAEVPAEPGQWQRGVAVVVGDPAREMRLGDVAVTFIRSDGGASSDVTGPGGWAFAPYVAGKPVVAVDLQFNAGAQKPLSAHLPITPLDQGVQAVRVDTEQLVAPPFETMRLIVDGDELQPEDMPRGHYSRS